ERFGSVDLLVNDAGYGRHVLFKDHDAADIERMMRTNYLGVVWATKAVLPAMRARRRGWIVNISSVAGKLGQPDEAAYSASKFAVTGLSEGLSYELAPLGIHVMTVYPALVRTEMFTPEVMARMPRGAGAHVPGAARVLAARAAGARAGAVRGDGAGLHRDRVRGPRAAAGALSPHDGASAAARAPGPRDLG